MKTQCAATVFFVTDLNRSVEFYTENLGFSESFRFGDYAGICHGEVLIHLSQHATPERPAGHGAIYIFCDEVDEFYREITAKGVRTAAEPKEYPYKMRDFLAYDPDGNQLCFGTEVKG